MGRLYLRVVILIFVTLNAATAFANVPFSIEQILSAPFPSDMVASPKDSKIAWVFNDKGVRNIWVAEAPDYCGRQLTAYREDDGQVITGIHFSPNGQNLVYVRGGDANQQGEIPNPLVSPDGYEQAIWTVPLTEGGPRCLAEGKSPTISPDGSRVAFIKDGQVWIASLSEDVEPKQLFKIRGSADSLNWSPDSSRPKLAFVSTRNDHSFVGIYDFAPHTIRYLDPSVDQDGNPTWSPDGREVAYTRIPHERYHIPLVPKRTGFPWSIHIADVTTGRGRQIWKASEGAGSVFRGVSANRQLFWGNGNRLVFPWEGDGWTHLYSVSTQGGNPLHLTPGTFEVQFVSMTPDRQEILFSSNQNDIDRRHIWRVSIAGGPARAVTSGTGIEWAPVMTAGDRTIALSGSTATRPAHPYRLTANGTMKSLAPTSIPDDFPSGYLVEPKLVIFAAPDGMELHGQLFLPPNHRPDTRYPAVLFFHGGPQRQMLRGFHHADYYHNAYALNQYLANKGYIVFSVNFRSGIGYGMEFREALNYGAGGTSEFNDVVGGGLYLRGRSDVDPDRIGLWGGSYGGYLTALGLSRASDLFRAGVDIHGVHDWNVVIRNFVPSYDAEGRQETVTLAFESSPMFSLDDWRSPVLLIHGDDDRNVPFSETVNLVEELRKRGVYFEQVIFPDEVHGFLKHATWIAAYRATADFLERMLKAEKKRKEFWGQVLN